MKNKVLYILVIIGLIAASVFALFFFRNKFSDNNSNYDAQKTATSDNSISNTSNSVNNANSSNNSNTANTSNTSDASNITNNITTKNETSKPVVEPPKETQLSTFSTKIYTKESARQNNMQLTASRLHGHIVKSGETFSFCNILGPSSTEEGYQEADIFDNQGNKKKGLGGGNCQISSTLYNAVLAAPGLTVVERHEHSNNVPYVQKGKDAAVAYGSYDFKFKNETGNDIKLLFEVSADTVTTTIVKLQ